MSVSVASEQEGFQSVSMNLHPASCDASLTFSGFGACIAKAGVVCRRPNVSNSRPNNWQLVSVAFLRTYRCFTIIPLRWAMQVQLVDTYNPLQFESPWVAESH